mgnify:CR=1 FL=1|jgi:uncharacterized cupredoxin-like copper-binding protein
MIMRLFLIIGLILLGGTGYFIVVQTPPTVQATPAVGEIVRLREEGILPEGIMFENEEIEHDIFGVPPEDEAMIEAAMANMDMDMGGMDMGGMDMGGDGDMDMAADGDMDMAADVDMDMAADGDMDMATDGDMDMAADGDMDMAADGDMNMAADGGMDMAADGDMNMAADGDMDMATDGDMNMATDGDMNMAADGDMNMAADGDMNMAADSGMDMATDGDMNMAADGGMDMAEGGAFDEEEAERLMAGQMAGLIITDEGDFDREIELSMSEWTFSDLEIDAQPGERIRFTLRNDGNIVHEFMFMGMAQMQGVNYRARRADWNLLEHEALYEQSLVLPGEEITFVAEVLAPGAWMFMCMLPYHMQMGMMGQMATEGMAMEM